MQYILHYFSLLDEPTGQPHTRRIVFTLALWHHRHRSRQRLAVLDDRELHDIGLSPAERAAECEKRFWQA